MNTKAKTPSAKTNATVVSTAVAPSKTRRTNADITSSKSKKAQPQKKIWQRKMYGVPFLCLGRNMMLCKTSGAS